MISLFAGLFSLFSATAELGLQGYVEGEYLRIGAPVAGTLSELDVREGTIVSKGSRLFSLDLAPEQANREQTAALLDQAEASLMLSQVTLKRQEALARANAASLARLDEAQAALTRDVAIIHQRKAELARIDIRLRDMVPSAPADAFVEKIYYRPGEYVNAGQPVVSLLPPGNIKLVFFLPEKQVGALKMGQSVAFSCDGCAPGASAKISFIASQAEYTPPVIYSVETRAKLVFRIEGRPEKDPQALHPGQPVAVQVALPQ